jgi:CheY-like chemotaxis protein
MMFNASPMASQPSSSSASVAIARHLPYLRRYARAITGDQRRGDGAVRRCLQSLLELELPTAPDQIRRVMYRTLHDVWQEAASARAFSATSEEAIVEARLDTLPALERRALLLVALEGFSFADAAYVLRLESEDEAVRLFEDAKQDLRRQEATRVLIIEDEPMIALDIASMVEQRGHTVVGIAATHKEAVELAAAKRPGLILADIQLADDSSGIAAVNEILEDHAVPTVFITAFPERLLTGDRREPVYLVTKPFDPETLDVTISQALVTRQSRAGHV